MYHTPTGYIYADSEGVTEEEATAKARERCQFGLVDIAWMTIYEERDERADGGAEGCGDKPSATRGNVLRPEPVPPRERVKVGRHAHHVMRDWNRLVNERAAFGVEEDVYLVGKRDEVKIAHLPKHRLLIYGDFQLKRGKPASEVADLAGVPVDLEEVPGEVGRHGFHGRLRSVAIGGLATILVASLAAAVAALIVGALE